MKELLTHSRLAAFRRCPRLHHYAYARGIRARRTALALLVGTIFHAAVEAYWLARQRGFSAEAAVDAALMAFQQRCYAIQDPYVEVLVESLVVAYCSKWNARNVRVLGIEQQFRMPLVDPRTGDASNFCELGGKMDRVIQLEDGRIALCEVKTSSADVSPGSDYVARLALDGQIDIYLDGARSLGYDASVVIYDVARKPLLKPLRATSRVKLKKDGAPAAGQRLVDETPEEYGERVQAELARNHDVYLRHVELGRTDAQGDAYRFDVWAWAKRIADDAAAGDSPRNPDSCLRWGAQNACSYFPVCTGRASIDDPALFEVVGAHVELREESEEGEGT